MAINSNFFPNIKLTDAQREKFNADMRALPGNISSGASQMQSFYAPGGKLQQSISGTIDRFRNAPSASASANYIATQDLTSLPMGVPNPGTAASSILGGSVSQVSGALGGDGSVVGSGLGGIANNIKGSIGNTVSSIKDRVSSVFNPSTTRKTAAGLESSAIKNLNPGVSLLDAGSSTMGDADRSSKDWRVRVSIPAETNIMEAITNAGGVDVSVLGPLHATGGVLFPYLPVVDVMYRANYSQQKLTHSNYATYAYDNSEITDLRIVGDFTVQNQHEGRYLFAVIQFFRTVTKMFYGKDDTTPASGNPPPLVFVDGYGYYYLPHVPCVVTQFKHSLSNDVDYLEVNLSDGGRVFLPTHSSIEVMMQPVYSRNKIYNDFNIHQFGNGDMLSNRKGML